MQKKKLLILSREQEEFAERVRQLELENLEIFAPQSEAEIREILPEIEIFLANPPLAVKYVHLAPKLKWVQSAFAGIDLLVSRELRQDYLLTNVKETYGPVMAEYVFAYIFLFEKKLRENLAWQAEKVWAQQAYVSVSEKTLGIVGTGSIGCHIARVAKAFGMQVLGFNSSGEGNADIEAVYQFDASLEQLKLCDYLVSVLPSTAKTRGLLNGRFFESLKPTAIFINVGRGDAVVDEDLLLALRTNKLRAAVLDVFVKEPLPEQHPYWTEPKVILTPHVSGYCISGRIFEIFAENYKRYIKGEELLFQVDFERGY